MLERHEEFFRDPRNNARVTQEAIEMAIKICQKKKNFKVANRLEKESRALQKVIDNDKLDEILKKRFPKSR